MAIVTARRDGSPMAKPFAWSFSKLKNFEQCPLRYYETDIVKSVKQTQSDALDWGDLVHKAAHGYITSKAPMPVEAAFVLEPWMKRLEATPGELLSEQKYAITKDFAPCGYFDHNVWCRVVIDVLKINDTVALTLDWKTGKILEDSFQLGLYAQCVFAHHPKVQKIRTEFVWLKEDATSSENFSRSDLTLLWQNLLPRVERLRTASLTNSFLPTPNFLCANYCGVTKCAHHGKKY